MLIISGDVKVQCGLWSQGGLSRQVVLTTAFDHPQGDRLGYVGDLTAGIPLCITCNIFI